MRVVFLNEEVGKVVCFFFVLWVYKEKLVVSNLEEGYGLDYESINYVGIRFWISSF